MGNNLKIEFGEPVVVTMAPVQERRWGCYQFPRFDLNDAGDLVVTCHVGDDSHDDAGERNPQPYRITHDNGNSWEPFSEPDSLRHTRVLRDGTEIRFLPRQKRPAGELGILPAHEGFRDHYNNRLNLYRYEDLPDVLQGIRIARRLPGSNSEELVTAPLDAPGFLAGAHTLTGTSAGKVELPGNISPYKLEADSTECLELPDGTLLYAKKAFRADEEGALLPGECQMYLLASTDRGSSWRLRSTIAYIPDRALWGLHEQTLTLLANGTLVCVMRSDEGGKEEDPRNLYIGRSNDDGFTWSAPEVLNPFGVEPELLTLENGVTALSYGRPGVQFRFSSDPYGQVWTDPHVILDGGDFSTNADYTCGYTKLHATGPDSLLIVYSDFKHQDDDGNVRKAILIRHVRVN